MSVFEHICYVTPFDYVHYMTTFLYLMKLNDLNGEYTATHIKASACMQSCLHKGCHPPYSAFLYMQQNFLTMEKLIAQINEGSTANEPKIIYLW